jgi:hypothetical protein
MIFPNECRERAAECRQMSEAAGSLRLRGILIGHGKDMGTAAAAFIEFGPPHSRSRGLVRGGALADGERWPIKKGHHRFVALAIWRPDKTLAKTCADFSDLEIGPDGYLYLLSDKSSTIARLDDLPAGGGTSMSDPIDIQFFASQREFDELQAALVENLPDFRLYLSANNPNERRQYEQDLSIRPEFQRWQALAAKIAALYAAQGQRS